MKKGLLSILALAVTIVGCQNYDDQFDALNTQITALKSQVDGLAAVQSAVTALQGQLASLSSAALTSADLDAALSSGLADIISDVEAVQAAVADVASAADVTAVSDALTDAQEDLDELLAQGSVFTGDVTVTSESTLDAFLAMGDGLAIVNGNVTITPTAGMDQTRVQELVDNIVTVIKDFTYTAPSSDYAATTFTALTGVQTLTLKQGGSYDARNLTSASKIVLDNTYKSTVTLVHLGALNNVTTLQDEDGPAGTVNLNKVEEFHLTSLVRYPGNNLDITTKEGAVLDISSLTDQDSDGDAVGAGYSLSIDGPASVTLTTISDGTINLDNVATANISGFIGETVVGAGVNNLTLTGAVDLDISAAADLEVASITGALDSDSTLATADTAGPAIVFASQDLVTATVAGITAAVNATSQSNLETLTVSADMKGSTLTVSGNGDLVTLSVTGAKIGDVIVHDNDDLESVTLDHTTALATGVKGVTAKITDNANLTTARYSADKVDILNVSDNAQLETIDFTGLATIGTATSVTVDVKDNKLTATLAKDAHNTVATTDAGSYTSTSGMNTLKTYLTAANLATTKDIEVYFDVLEQVQTQASATANYVDVTHTDSTTGTGRNAVLVSTTTPVTGSTVRQTQTFVFEPQENGLNAQKTVLNTNEKIELWAGGVTATYEQSASVTTLAQLISYINADTTFGSNFTVTAAQDAYKKSIQKVNYLESDGATAATTSQAGNLYFTFGTITGTIALGVGSGVASITTALASQISDATNRNSATSQLNLYNASASGAEVTIYRTVSNAGYGSDFSQNAGSIPTIAFTIDAAQTSTTALLADVASNSAGLASDYYLNVNNNTLSGLRIKFVNEGQSSSQVATITISNNDVLPASVTALVSGTNVIGTKAIIAGFSDISNTSGGVTTTTSRLGWL